MHKHFLTLAFAVIAFLAGGFSAQAEERWPRWYVGLHGSMVIPEDADIGANGEIEFDNGWGGSLALGYLPGASSGLFNYMRFEFEAAYRGADVDRATIGGVPVAGASAEVDSLAWMANAYVDIPTGTTVTPYLGAGIGWAHVQMDTTAGFGTTDDEDSVFAYQFMAGISCAPQTLPHVVFDVGYRYFATDDPSYSTAAGDVDFEHKSQNIEAGARFRF